MNLRRKVECDEANTISKISRHLAMSALGVVAFIFVLEAHATNMTSFPVVLSLPNSSDTIERSIVRLGNERLNEGFEFTQNMDDVTINDPFKIKMSGLRANAHIRGRLDRDIKGLIVEAEFKNLVISIDRISIHSIVKARVSGVDAQIRIDAECTDSKISWTKKSEKTEKTEKTIAFFVRGRFLTKPILSMDISGLALPSEIPKPEMTLTCKGPFGIEETISNFAWSALQQRWTDSQFANELETQLEKSFSSMIAPGGSGLKLINRAELRATLIPSQYKVDVNSSRLSARLEIQFDRPVTIPKIKNLEMNVLEGSSNQVTLSLGTRVAQSILQQWFSPGVWSEWIEGQKVDGFRELMDSRLKQFVVWPDLQNYPKDAPFWFVVETQMGPILNCRSGSLEVSSPISVATLLKDSRFEIGYMPTVYFSVPTNVSITLPSVTTGTQMSARLQSMGLDYQFDPRYVASERPNAIIAADQIRGSIENFVESKITNLSAMDGAMGETVKVLNQMDVSCDSSQQMLHIRLPF